MHRDRTMNIATATVNAGSPPPPVIQESANQSLLNPVDVRNTLTIEVTDPTLQPTDQVSVAWTGAPGSGANGSLTTAFINAGNTRPLVIRIPVSLVLFNLSQTVTVTYTIIRGTAAPVTSEPQVVYVLPLAQRDLPRPFITQAEQSGEGPILDINGLTDITLRINAWPLSARGQFLWLWLEGKNADGSDFRMRYWSAPSNVITDEFIRFGFYERSHSANALQGLKDRSVLTLKLMVGLQGSPDESLAQPFAHRNYIVLTNAATPPAILSVTGPDGQDIADGADTPHTSVTLSGSAGAGGEVEIFDGPTPQGTVIAVGSAWTYKVAVLTGGLHVFTVKLADGSGGASSPWTINVVLQNLELTIAEAPDNGNLDPIAALTRLTAVLDYNMQADDRIRVIWTAAPGTPAAGSHTTNTVQAGTTIRPRIIQLPVSLLAFSLGKRVTVSFEYDRGTALPVVSRPLVLNIGTIPANWFVPPVITQANGTTVLNLANVQAGATLLFGGWPLIASGQPIWLDFEGQNASGGSHNLTMWTGPNFAVHRSWVLNGRYSVTVLYSYLKDLAEGSLLSIHFRVNLDQVPNPATAVVFAARQYTIRAIP